MSGAALLREELNSREAGNTSLLDDIAPAPVQDKGVMMANFEEWIKMATDNKINSTNSWNFALIDYFHDLDVLRGHDNNINFQKASATLDGCVKIYSSRVDSVATETGRLLSGLATKKEEVPEEEGEEELEEEEEDQEDQDDDNEGNTKKKTHKAKKRELGDKLTTFENLRIKKLSLELAIDPLFKKTLAEFDEGGAKSLLLNTLNMDKNARVVFDASTTNANDDEPPLKQEESDVIKEEEEGIDEDIEMTGMDDKDIDINSFKEFIYGDNEDLDGFTLCPSFDQLNSVLKDINKAKSILNDVNEQNKDFEFRDTIIQAPVDDDYDAFPQFDFGGDEAAGDSFGELENEAVAVLFQDELNEEQEEIEENNENGIVASVIDQDLMAYFDNTLRRNWAGPEHWRVRQLKKVKQHENQQEETQKVRKKKEPFKIDFLTEIPENDELKQESKIFSKGKVSSTLPEEEWKSKDSFLLPDDLFFSSDKLTRLFLKPEQKLNLFRRRVNFQSKEKEAEENRPIDASFWADNYENNEKQEKDNDDGFYDNDFGDGDAGFDGIYDDEPIPANLGTQLIKGNNKPKSDTLNYSKTAKNVNVKALKDNIWKVLEENEDEAKHDSKQFSEVVKDIAHMYPKEQKKDLSTSFCFICLLHLANEHSLVINNNESLTDLQITGLNQ